MVSKENKYLVSIISPPNSLHDIEYQKNIFTLYMYHVTPLDIKKKYALLGHGIGKFGSLQRFHTSLGIVVWVQS
jgi:hypothetical protein